MSKKKSPQKTAKKSPRTAAAPALADEQLADVSGGKMTIKFSPETTRLVAKDGGSIAGGAFKGK
jgi:hypothetical protein